MRRKLGIVRGRVVTFEVRGGWFLAFWGDGKVPIARVGINVPNAQRVLLQVVEI